MFCLRLIVLTSSFNMWNWTSNPNFNWSPALDTSLWKLTENVYIQSMTSPIYCGFSIFLATSTNDSPNPEKARAISNFFLAKASIKRSYTKQFLMLKRWSWQHVQVTSVLFTFIFRFLLMRDFYRLQPPSGLERCCLTHTRNNVCVGWEFFIRHFKSTLFPPLKATRRDTTGGLSVTRYFFKNTIGTKTELNTGTVSISIINSPDDYFQDQAIIV